MRKARADGRKTRFPLGLGCSVPWIARGKSPFARIGFAAYAKPYITKGKPAK
jgi:hypothetical protein